MAAMMAHITEHVGYAYRQRIEQQLGMSLPAEDAKLPPEVESSLSSMMAQAAQRVLQQSQSQVAQQQAQQAQQDPLVQMQQAELQLRAKELDIKEKKLAADAAAHADKIEVEKQRVSSQTQIEGMKVSAQIQDSQAKLQAQQQREGVRLGIDIAKAKAQERMTARQAALQHAASVQSKEPPIK